jgi:hypothetical protein
MGPSVKRYNAGDSTDLAGPILNAIPFARLNDPRVSVKIDGKAEDNTSVYYGVLNWGRDDPVPVASGIDARLIEAEAKLQANDIAGMMTILNALRTAPPKLGNFQPATMTALPTPATQDAAISLYFREKALWQYARGQRLSDLRRLVRQYGRAQDKVYPSGQQYKGVPYGSDTAMPVPDAERVNPQFSGCLDKNA